MNKLLFVYGSLMKGMHNHRLLERSKLVGRCKIFEPFELVSLGSFPGLVPDEFYNSIYGEVYEVSPAVYNRVEILEGYPNFYTRELVDTEHGLCETYVLADKKYKSSCNPVKSGDWISYITNRQEETI